jgi:excisionase family DNA binding protein
MTTCERAIDAVQVGQILHLHPRTVIRRAKANEIPAFQVGKYWRFLPSMLDAWMREKSVRKDFDTR